MRRLSAAMFALAVVLIAPGIANAQCKQLPGQRADRLAKIAVGQVMADVAFIGKVVDRREAVRHGKGIGTALQFRVVATFKGAPERERTVLLNSGCFKGQCVLNSEEQQFRGHRLQLVFANHHPRGLVSASTCTDAGPLTAGEVALLLHPSTLPMTGSRYLMRSATTGGGLVFVGALLLSASRRRGLVSS